MSTAGITATRLLVQDALRVIDTLSADDWQRDSACPGWRVQDVITHMAVFFHSFTDPGVMPADDLTRTAERINDAAVRERADWSPARVAAYYEQQSAAGIAALEALQSPQYADVTADIAELGTYRLSEMSNAVAFDHLVHLSSDILAPFGPVRQPPIALAPATVGPALDWMLSGLPQMCRTALYPVLTRPIGMDLHGPAARRFLLRRAADTPGAVEIVQDAPLPEDVVHSSTADFLRWATTRTDWRPTTRVDGDLTRVAPVMDAINVI